MENSQQTISPTALPMERIERIKVFAILSKHNVVPHELVNDKLVLALVIAYTPAEAIMGAQTLIARHGRLAEDYKTPYMIIGRELGVLQATPPPVSSEKLFAVDRIQKEAEAKVGAVTKSITDLSSYVRYVFDKAGTPAQKRTAELVIVKFQEYAKSQNQ